jgi:glycosyltransferase involved in cell wall biosynthesis
MPVSKIVVINDTSTDFGGTTALALLSVRQFRARGLRVVYICGDSGENPELAGLGVEVVAAGSAELLKLSFAKAFVNGIYNIAAKDLVARYIAENDDPDTVYHVHGWAQILSPSIFSALAPVAARCFFHAHDMFLACPNGVYMDYKHREVCHRRPLSLSCVLCNCDKRSYFQKGWRVMRHTSLAQTLDLRHPWAGIIALHPAMVPRLARAGYPEAMFHILRNPVTPFSTTRIKAEDNSDLVYVGRLEEDKGVLYLAEAAARTGMRLVCIGDGALRGVMEQRFPDVVVTGWMPREKIGPLLTKARALVMSSLHPEPFALVLPEALESGLPVAVVKTALLAEEIVAAGLGVSFDMYDSASADAALIRIRDASADEIRKMSIAGHSKTPCLANTVQQWTDGLVSLYESVVP